MSQLSQVSQALSAEPRRGADALDAARLAAVLSAIANDGGGLPEDGAGRPDADAGQGLLGGLGLYVVANRVVELAAGVYRYRPQANALTPMAAARTAGRLASCAADPAPLVRADVVLGLSAGAGRSPVAAASRAVRSAAALGLSGTVVAGFADGIGELLALPAGHRCCVLVALSRAFARS